MRQNAALAHTSYRCVGHAGALAEGTGVPEGLSRARRAAFGQAVARLQQMSGAAVATLRKMMVDQAAPASTRVRAAECIINRAAKAIEIEDIEARVSELERAAGTQKPPGGRS
jgi:hypothetical protein